MFAVVEFGTVARTQFDLNDHTTHDDLIRAIDRLPHHRDYGYLTYPGVAVDHTTSQVLVQVSNVILPWSNLEEHFFLFHKLFIS